MSKNFMTACSMAYWWTQVLLIITSESAQYLELQTLL